MSAAVIAAGLAFVCTPVSVWDGDGPIRCAEGPKIRIAGIAAREIDETCRQWQPCPAASGRAARDALVALLGRPIGVSRDGHVLVAAFGPLRCRSQGDARGDRTAASCALPDGRRLSCALLATRTVRIWRVFWVEARC